MVLVVSVIAACAGCTNDSATTSKPAASPQSQNTPSPVPSAGTTTGAVPTRLKPPAEVAGELSRTVWAHKDGHPDNVTTVRTLPDAGREYQVQAACLSTTPGKVLSVEVRSGKPGASDQVIAATDVPCDGTVAGDSLSNLPAEPIIIDLTGGQSDVSSAYALISPAPTPPQ